MDTRLKKFKYSLFTKLLCWLIALCTFCLSASFMLQIFINCIVVGFDKYYLNDKKITYFESYGFQNRFNQDFSICFNLSTNNAGKLTEGLKKQKDTVVEDALQKFLDYKASVIASELQYAVENWDDSYYNYDGQVDVTIPSDYNTKVYINITDPESIQTAQKILVNAKGQEFLLYENLVRDSAFDQSYNYSDVIRDGENEYEIVIPVQLSLTESEAKENISKEYDEFIQHIVEANCTVSLDSLARLESRKNLKYYVVDLDGVVYSNIPSIPKNLKNNDRYILANKGNYDIKGLEHPFLPESFEENNYNVLCLYFDESFAEDDVYGRMYNVFKNAEKQDAYTLAFVVLVSLIFSIVFFVFWLSLVGKKTRSDKAELNLIFKIPAEIQIAIVGGILCALYVCLHDILQFGTEYFDNLIFLHQFKIIFVCVVCIVCVLFSGLICSFVKVKKTGKSIIKGSLIYNLLRVIFKGILFVCRFIKGKTTEIFAYKPKVFKYKVALSVFVYFALNLFISFVLYLANYFTVMDGIVSFILTFILLLGFNGVVGYFVVRYLNNLDKIIIASGEHSTVDFGGSKVDSSLLTLAENLENYNDELQSAVNEAVKNEQMKTQLITNVSHDLKTPLTSLINYSDLLSKCEINDETAVEYIGVINNQSDKLKRLIEDLIEASKASTGNVQLNKIKLNLSELAVQAIVEFAPDFDSNKNEIKFTEPEKAPVVYADSVKTYRIISNLFSNAKKYSAKGTRVYASVYEDNLFGYFEIKNISREPLNISPETLTERFVRGDESRTNEGNGLGLSIAKDLCKLQGGDLSISIDGDLFKATVKLPKS